MNEAAWQCLLLADFPSSFRMLDLDMTAFLHNPVFCDQLYQSVNTAA